MQSIKKDIERTINTNAKASAIKGPLLVLLKEVNGKKKIASLAKDKGVTLYRNYPMVILYMSGLYHMWLNKCVESEEWIIDHIFGYIKQTFKSYIEESFSGQPPLFREILAAKT